MKNVISSFIKEHPIMSFLLADVIVRQTCSMVKTVVRGYPEETNITYKHNDDDGPELEVIENEEEPDTSEES